jgi:hypothetical protein
MDNHVLLLHQVEVLVMFAGIGMTHATAWRNSSHFLIFVVSDNLTESLALHDWDEKERNAIVARIARITITTISSTRVKAENFFELYINYIFKNKLA